MSDSLVSRGCPAVWVQEVDTGATLNADITNSALINNCGLDISGGTVSLTNATVTGNRGAVFGGVRVSPVNNATVNLKNTILWGNRAPGTGADLRMEGTAVVNADHSDIGDRLTVSGTFNDLGGNIDADPRVKGPRRDVHLTPGSPAIDTGTCTGAPTTDFEGDPRPSGAGCDIGADEFVP